MGGIVILTGAGISAESGLGTFRDLGGVWTQVRLEEVATPEAFIADPARVRAFYDARRAQARAAEPNAAHYALARLQRTQADVLIVTQNVDGLHARAGSTRLLPIHGTLDGALCAACDHRWPWGDGPMTAMHACPSCHRTGCVRPDVVWFGEMPHGLDAAYAALADCDLFVSIGTSGAVYPAAGFVAEARAAGARTLELNLERSAGSHLFHETRLGPATRLVPDWVGEVLGA